MLPVERIRPSIFPCCIVSLFLGCMHPERAGQERLAQSENRDATRATVMPLNSRAQSPEWGRGRETGREQQTAGDAGSKSADTSPVAQVSGRDQGRGNSVQSIPVTPSESQANPSAPAPVPIGNSPPGSTPPGRHETAPALTSVPNSPGKLRELYNQAALRFATMDSYLARLRRREQVKGKDHPEEVMLFKFRKQPWSVYFKWLGTEGQGREVIYVKGQHGDMIHSLLAAGDMPLAPAGKHMALSPDNIFVRSASRHAITEAGIGVMIEKFGLALEAQERGEKKLGAMTYLGSSKRPEFETPLEAVEHFLPPGVESQLPRGGRRWIFFDPVSHLPVLMITHDDKGHEVEYYCYDRLQYPVKLDDLDFDPDRLWPAKK